MTTWLLMILLFVGIGLFIAGMFLKREEAANKKAGYKMNVKRNRLGTILAIIGFILVAIFWCVMKPWNS